jgi:hypothetical protein
MNEGGTTMTPPLSNQRSWLFCLLALGACEANSDRSPIQAAEGVRAALLASPSTDASADAAELTRIQAFLDGRYAATDVQYSFHTKFGETIDCIDFFAQPGAKILAARGTPITQLPTVAPPPISPHTPQLFADVAFDGQPDDQGNARACPGPTVPMLRITAAQILAVGGLDVYLSSLTKHRGPLPAPHQNGQALPPDSAGAYYAHVQTDYVGGTSLSVGQATLPVFSSYVQGGSMIFDHSLGQTWTISSDSTQTVETGYNIDPDINLGDKTNPHLFIYSTTTNYSTGCYNNTTDYVGSVPCDGVFVETVGAPYTPGMTLTSTSFYGTYQTMDFYTYYGSTGTGTNGWIIWNVGYYPSTNFSGSMASGSAGRFSAGDEVSDHTKQWVIPIGSGTAATAGYELATFVEYMEVLTPGVGASISTISIRLNRPAMRWT